MPRADDVVTRWPAWSTTMLDCIKSGSGRWHPRPTSKPRPNRRRLVCRVRDCDEKRRGVCKQRHRQGFFTLLKHVGRGYLDVELDGLSRAQNAARFATRWQQPPHPRTLQPDRWGLGEGSLAGYEEPVWFGIPTSSHPPRQRHLGPGPDDQDWRLHHRLEPAQTPFIRTKPTDQSSPRSTANVSIPQDRH